MAAHDERDPVRRPLASFAEVLEVTDAPFRCTCI
jgi:hypothetical protein